MFGSFSVVLPHILPHQHTILWVRYINGKSLVNSGIEIRSGLIIEAGGAYLKSWLRQEGLTRFFLYEKVVYKKLVLRRPKF